MRDWIVGYRKAAVSTGPGVPADAWTNIEARAGVPVPEELRDFYSEMDGARFDLGIELFPMIGPAGTITARAADGMWRFGSRGSQVFFAARKRALPPGEMLPEWTRKFGDDVWLYDVKDEQGQRLKLYSSLERLLEAYVPPARTEEFGDLTYARALGAVKRVIEELPPPPEKRPKPKGPASKTSRPAKKSAPRKRR